MKCSCGYEGKCEKATTNAHVFFYDRYTGEKCILLEWADYPINICPKCGKRYYQNGAFIDNNNAQLVNALELSGVA